MADDDKALVEKYAVWPENHPDKVRYAKTRFGAEWLMFWVGLLTMQRMVCLYPAGQTK